MKHRWPTPVGVYRNRWANLLLASAAVGGGIASTSDFSEHAKDHAGLMVSWRLPAIVLVTVLVAVRCARRGVIVSHAGIEGRMIIGTWRVPWRVIKSHEIRGSSRDLTQAISLTLVDGTKRNGAIGRGRRGDEPLDTTIANLRTEAVDSPGFYAGLNHWLIAFAVLAIGLGLSLVTIETDDSNRQMLLGDRWHPTTFDLVARPWVGALVVATAVVGVVAVRAQRCPHGVEPTGPWPAKLRFPDASLAFSESPHPLDVPGPVTVSSSAVVSDAATLVGAISRHRVSGSPSVVHCFWYARGLPAFRVQTVSVVRRDVSTGPICAWILIDSEQDAPRFGLFETPDHRVVLFHDGRSVAELRPTLGTTAPADRQYGVFSYEGETMAGIVRRGANWMVSPHMDMPRDLWRVVLVSALWAERTHRLKHSSV